MKRAFYGAMSLAVLAMLGGCATSFAEFESAKPQSVEIVPADYEAVYERVYRMARRCYLTSGMTASTEVNAQLFPHAGYGELLFVFVNMGIKNPQARVRVERADAGSRVSITTAGLLEDVQLARRQKLMSWALGEEAC